MTIPATGTVTLRGVAARHGIAEEFGGAKPDAVGEYYRGKANVPASAKATIATAGAQKFSNYRGSQKIIIGRPLASLPGIQYSASDNSAQAVQALEDNNWATMWNSTRKVAAGTRAWWQVTFPRPMTITRLRLDCLGPDSRLARLAYGNWGTYAPLFSCQTVVNTTGGVVAAPTCGWTNPARAFICANSGGQATLISKGQSFVAANTHISQVVGAGHVNAGFKWMFDQPVAFSQVTSIRFNVQLSPYGRKPNISRAGVYMNTPVAVMSDYIRIAEIYIEGA